MSLPVLKQTYAKALEHVGHHVRRTLVESANHITTQPYVARLLGQDASQRILAEELFKTALRNALSVPSHPAISVAFDGEYWKKIYSTEAQRTVNEWANKGLLHIQRTKIMVHFACIGIRSDVASNLASLVMKAPEQVRIHAQIEQQNPAGH